MSPTARPALVRPQVGEDLGFHRIVLSERGAPSLYFPNLVRFVDERQRNAAMQPGRGTWDLAGARDLNERALVEPGAEGAPGPERRA